MMDRCSFPDTEQRLDYITTLKKKKKKLTTVMRGEAELGESDAGEMRDRSVILCGISGKKEKLPVICWRLPTYNG